MSRINLRYYKNHPPRQLTNFDSMCLVAVEALDTIRGMYAAWGDALFRAARDAFDTIHSREFLAAYAEACKMEREEVEAEKWIKKNSGTQN